MRDLSSLLRRFHGRSFRAELLRKGLLWASLSVSALALLTAGCIVFSLPSELQLGATLVVASLLPAFLFWPVERRRLLAPLRECDRDDVAESWLEARPAARAVLAKKLADLGPRFEAAKRGPRFWTEGLRRPAVAAVLSVALLQMISISLLAKPVFVWNGPGGTAGSGLRLSEAEELRAREEALKSPFSLPREAPREGEAVARDSRQAAMRDAEGLLKGLPESSRTIPGVGENPSLPSENGPSPTGGPGVRLPAAPEGDKTAGRPDLGEGGPNAPPSEEGKRGITGFEGSGASGVPSPLIDYKSKLFKELAAKEGRDMRASGDLVTMPLAELQRRWFSSFELSAGIGPREDSWTSLLRRRWAGLMGGGEAGK